MRNEIWRCLKLLQSELPDEERKLIEQRLVEQCSAFERLLATTFPFTLRLKSTSVPVPLNT